MKYMTFRHLFMALLLPLALPAQAQMKAARSAALVKAKNLTATDGSQAPNYYLISSNDAVTLHFQGDRVQIGKDLYETGQLKMRFRTIPHRLMDEDSVAFYKKDALDHTLVGLRRTLSLNEWNSIILPFDLPGAMVKEVFGEDAQLALLKGISEEDEAAIDFQTVVLDEDGATLKANQHYLLRPTKEPDVAANRTLTGFISERVKGPLYLFPDVSMKANPTPRFQDVKNGSGTTVVRFRGLYNAMDGTTSKNKKLAPGTYAIDEETNRFTLYEDSLALKAFRSYATDLSENPKSLKLAIDGVELADGIGEIRSSQVVSGDERTYDLLGRRVAVPARKGIYIINGKKVVIR
ncbi:MAG: hypothetical protein K2O17_03480 [Bacteroidaceae bacterium]|nr:hypothetical protein [Bacteroidaceae bacterium]